MAVMVLSGLLQALHHLGDVMSVVEDRAEEIDTVVTAVATAAAAKMLRRTATDLVAHMLRVSRRYVYRVVTIREMRKSNFSRKFDVRLTVID